MRYHLLMLLVLAAPACRAQQADPSLPGAEPITEAVTRTDFHIKYVSGTDVYIDGGTSSGLTEGAELVLRPKTTLSDEESAGTFIEPGVVARLKVVSVSSTSAVCEVVATKRDLTKDDLVSLPDSEIKKIINKDTVGSTRHTTPWSSASPTATRWTRKCATTCRGRLCRK